MLNKVTITELVISSINYTQSVNCQENRHLEQTKQFGSVTHTVELLKFCPIQYFVYPHLASITACTRLGIDLM